MAINAISLEDYKYRFDLAAAFSSDDIKITAKKSGFLHIVDLIEDELRKKNLLSSLFVEFNLVGTILTPDTPNKLNSLVYIREGDSHFADRIKKYSDSIIEQFVKEREYTLFFHPEVFIDPQKPQVCYSVIKNTIEEKEIQYIDDITKIKEDYYTRLSTDANIYIGKASFDRDYHTILDKASKIREKGIDVNDELTEFHKLYHYVIGNNISTAYVTIPILGAQAANRIEIPNIDNIQGQGVIFLFFTIPQGSFVELDSILEDVTSNLFLKLGDFVRLISYNYLFNLGLQLQNKAKNEAIKSAKAAIMSRNMSHNIGSHVMSYLKQHLGSVTTIVNDNVLAEMITSSSDRTAIQKDTPLPFLVGMGHFLSYIQERQDFIATIATDYIPYFASINFKDFVYDEINPDKRFERHKDRKNLQPDNILLGNIARSEGLGRTIQTTSKRSGQLSDIVLNFCSKTFSTSDGSEEDINTCIEIWNSNGNVFDGEPVVNSSNVTIAGRENAYKALEAMRKWEVSLPGGVIGRQAIFSIIENIIRNTAKHGNWRNQGRLELTFDFYDKYLFEKDFVKKFVQLKKEEVPILRKLLEFQKKEKNGIVLSDSEQNEYDQIKKDYVQIREKLEPWNKDAAAIDTSHHWPGRDKHNSLLEILYLFYSKSIDADDLYFVTITDNVNISESAVNKLREALIDPYVDDDSKMKEENKGIKEIRISAAWLRGAKNEDEYYKSGDLIEAPQTGLKAPLVYVRQHNGCLQYIICLQKPRNVAVITRAPLSEAAINALKERGWRYYSPEDYIKERNKSYRFTLCEDKDLYNMIRPFSSSRVYVFDRIDYMGKIKAGLSEEDSKNLERYLYESLVSDKATIWIDDDKAKGVMPSKINEDKDYAVEIERDITYYQVKDVDVRVIDGCHSHVDYTYRKHHDTLEQFTSFMEINPNGCQFVESITGDTSTDRLVRNEKYDFRWYYSHLNAMRKKVAIFDERLFSRIYGLEEADFTKGSASDLKELKKKYCEQYPIYKRRINDFNTFDDLNKFIETKKLSIIAVSKNDVYTKDYIALTYYQKGIYFYTLIKDSTEDSSKRTTFGVYGLYFNRNDCSIPKHKENYTCCCERVATITWTGQTIDVDFDASSKKHIENQFDFISIHQGLLDKLYEAFDIKYSKEKKIQLTTTLLEKFGHNSYDKHEWDSGFVPGLIVHSGRSKPAESDMPQMLPFIQYASIEHAVLDCKYSLIDLLENARYEQ